MSFEKRYSDGYAHRRSLPEGEGRHSGSYPHRPSYPGDYNRHSQRPSGALDLQAEEEYYEQRSIVSPRPLSETRADVSDFYARPAPSPTNRASFDRVPNARSSSAHHNSHTRTSTQAQYIKSETEMATQVRVSQEKSIVEQNYEEFIRRLQAENFELKNSEHRLLQVATIKKNLEIELEQVSTQLALHRRSGSEPAVERLKQLVQELTEQKAQLRRQLEQSKYDISQLVANVTSIRSSNDGEVQTLRGQLGMLQANYDRLMADYRTERGKPIQIPDDPQLRRLLEEKMSEVENLKARVRFLDDQLRAKSKPCTECPTKEATIMQLRGQMRELELREQRRSVSRQDVIHNSVMVYPFQAEKNGCARTACGVACCGCTCATVCCTDANCQMQQTRGTSCGRESCDCLTTQSTFNTTNVTETVTTTPAVGLGRVPDPVMHRVIAGPAVATGMANVASWQAPEARRAVNVSPGAQFRPSAPASVYADVPMQSGRSQIPENSITQELLTRHRSATRSTGELTSPGLYRHIPASPVRYSPPQMAHESAVSSLKQNFGTVRTETYSLS